MSPGSWYMGIDYESARGAIVEHMKSAKSRKQRCYDSILLIQLENGLRASEAVRAYREYLSTGQRCLEVYVSRRWVKRVVVIPDEVEACAELSSTDPAKLTRRIISYVKYTYGFNSHSLRYAFIVHMLRKHGDVSLVKEITKQTRVHIPPER